MPTPIATEPAPPPTVEELQRQIDQLTRQLEAVQQQLEVLVLQPLTHRPGGFELEQVLGASGGGGGLLEIDPRLPCGGEQGGHSRGDGHGVAARDAEPVLGDPGPLAGEDRDVAAHADDR